MQTDRLTTGGMIAALFALVACVILIAAPSGLDPRAAQAAALTVFTIGLWATGALPEYVTALVFFLGAVLTGVAPPAVVFSGFTSTALWLIFAGLVLGVAIQRTGLGERLARSLVERIGHSYPTVIAGLVIVALVLSFLMPSSMSRVVLLVPITVAFADALGFDQGSRGRIGMVMATGMGCFVPGAAILPAAVPNMVLVGAAEAQYGMQFAYGDYLLLHFPVIGFAYSAVIVTVTCLLCYEKPRVASGTYTRTPVTRDERRLLALLLAALALWATDFWHGIAPAWIGLGAALICLLPGVGLVPATSFARISMAPMLYVAGILGMAAVVVDTQLSDHLGRQLVAMAPLAPGAHAWDFAVLVGIASMAGFVATMAGMPAVLTPLADNLAAASGLALTTVIMTQVIGYATLVLPYQSPPLVVAMQLGNVRASQALRITLPYALIGFLVLMPVNYFWWRWLGMFTSP